MRADDREYCREVQLEILEAENRLRPHGFCSREYFAELWEEEDRLRTYLPSELSDHWIQDKYGRAVKFDKDCFEFEAVSMPRECHGDLHGNFVEDGLIDLIDYKHAYKNANAPEEQPRSRRRRRSRPQRRFLSRRTGEPRLGVRIVKVGEKAA